jgi:protein SCO1/2/putative membrane protein
MLLLLAGALLGGLSCRQQPREDRGVVGSFSLTERSGQTITNEDLRGKVWIASFILRHCKDGQCPQVTATMANLQKDLRLAQEPDLRLVSFTVDPERDQPKELQQYAESHHAHPDRWLFLTGNKDEIHRLIRESFQLAVAAKAAADFDHSSRLVLVDQMGHIRSYFEGLPLSDGEEDKIAFETNLSRLRQETTALLKPVDFPLLNACLNAASGVLLLLGWIAIKRRLVGLHKTCMLSALVTSAIFLGCYLYYHMAVQHGKPTYFSERAPEAPVWVARTYLVILGSHTILAALVTPLALVTAYFGLRNRLDRHVLLARWTFPLWLYVSVTGVVVYWMLYRLYPVP